MFKNKNRKRFLYLISVWCIFAIIGLSTLYLFRDSYALDINNNHNIPSNTFSSNYYSNAETNLIATALSGNSSYSGSVHNFEIATNYKTSNNEYPLYSMMKNLRFPSVNEKFEILDDNPIDVSDKGIIYILNHGYNPTNTTNTIFSTNKYGTLNDSSKEYVTQIALWLYLFEHREKFASTYCIDTGNIIKACDFYFNSGGAIAIMGANEVRKVIKAAASINGYNYLNYITLLVDNANSYIGKSESSVISTDTSKIEYIISSDSKSLVTSTITPVPSSNEENYMYYSVSINDPNNYGAYLVNTDNKKITNLNNLTGSFKLYVPFKEDVENMDLSSISVNITGVFVKNEGYTYRVTTSPEELINEKKKQKFADILLGYVPIETMTIKFSLKNITKIDKIDAANSEELPGATLELINKKDNSKIDSWTSTNAPKYMFLQNGDYKLCETMAPKGYQLSTECIDFSVDGKKVTSVTMKNNKLLEDVPNTFMGNNKILYLIGSVIIITGLFIIYMIAFRKNKSN